MKSLFFTLCLACGSLTGAAQVQLSVQGGFEIPDLTGNTSYHCILGYRVGAHLDLPITKRWALRTGAQVVRKKWKTDERLVSIKTEDRITTIREANFRANLTATYLQIPLKMVATFLIDKVIEAKVNAGLYAAYGIDGAERKRGAGAIGVEDNAPDGPGDSFDTYAWNSGPFKTFRPDNYRSFDVGLSVGADLYFKSFYFGGGIDFGLIPVQTIPKDWHQYLLEYDPTMVKAHNFSIEFHAGLRFKLGR
ncbi:MAG: PorT family protein [Prevotellaceae bacterium]|jgi:hypothetical protein|nr:PorT family protein [Prevotellaceae bacterium]